MLFHLLYWICFSKCVAIFQRIHKLILSWLLSGLLNTYDYYTDIIFNSLWLIRALCRLHDQIHVWISSNVTLSKVSQLGYVTLHALYTVWFKLTQCWVLVSTFLFCFTETKIKPGPLQEHQIRSSMYSYIKKFTKLSLRCKESVVING